MFSTFTMPATGTTANLRTLCAAIVSALAAQGLVQTADTGQLDPATVVFPSTTYTPAGYMIWRFADALQATRPIFIKLEIGEGAGAGYWEYWLTVGTGSDGAGNITGVLVPRNFQSANAYNVTSDVVTRTGLISGTSSRLTLALFAGATYCFVCNIERSKDSAGLDTSQGLIYQALVNSPTLAQVFIDFSVGTQYIGTKLMVPVDAPTTLSAGNSIGVSPIFPYGFGGLKQPGMGLLAYVDADIVRDVVLAVGVYGTNHNYWPLGASSKGFTSAGASVSLMMLAE